MLRVLLALEQAGMVTVEEIAELVREYSGHRRPITANTSLQNDLRLYGDDIEEILEAYSERFGVDMSSYLWYFHTGEEGCCNLGGMFFPPPSAYVTEIPITIRMLHEFAQQGRWGVEYPPHHFPEERYDLLVNRYIFVIVVVLGAVGFLVTWLARR